MSHIEDPTLKSKAPTSLLKAIGDIHYKGHQALSILVGPSDPDDANPAPSNVVDYAREASRNAERIRDEASHRRNQAHEVHDRLVGIRNDINLTHTALGLSPAQDYLPACGEQVSLTVLLHDAIKHAEVASTRLNEIMQAVGVVEHGDVLMAEKSAADERIIKDADCADFYANRT